MNAIHAVQDSKTPHPVITVEVERENDLVDEIGAITSFVVSDNGIGFDDENFDSFNEAYSERKLGRGGKGLGRFTWLKAFERVEITSTFRDVDGKTLIGRNFVFDKNYDPERVRAVSSVQAVGSRVALRSFQDPYRSDVPRDTEQLAERLIEHFILVFLHVSCPQIWLVDRGLRLSLNTIFKENFLSDSSQQEFVVDDVDFRIFGFKIKAPRLSRSRLVYAANDRGVLTENLDDFIPNLSGRIADGHGGSFVYLAVIQSPYLDQKVNSTRTDFDLANDDIDAQQSLFEISGEIPRSKIRARSLEIIENDLSGAFGRINDEKLDLIERYVQHEAPQYRFLLKYKEGFISKIKPGLSAPELEEALHRELHSRELALKREGAKIITEAAKLDEYGHYQDRLSSFMDAHNDLGVSALAQHVLHRKIIIDLFEKSLSLYKSTDKYPLEKIVHNIVFPMKSTNEDIMHSQQNLWLLDERLNYHSFIASDRSLKSTKEIESSSLSRPDLFIFDRKLAFAEGDQPLNSITIVEFKRPMRDDYTDEDNPLGQVFRMIKEIRASGFKDEHGRKVAVSHDKVPAYCYVVCDVTDSLKLILENMDASVTPDGLGYYGYHRTHKAYFEVIDYGKVLRDAKRRNKTFFEKLNILGNFGPL